MKRVTLDLNYARYRCRVLIKLNPFFFFFSFSKCKKEKIHDEIFTKTITSTDKRKYLIVQLRSHRWNFRNDWTPLRISIRIVKHPRPRSACYTRRRERFVEKIAYLKPFNYGYAPLISRTVSCSLLLERYELRLYIKLRSAFIVPTLRFFVLSRSTLVFSCFACSFFFF